MTAQRNSAESTNAVALASVVQPLLQCATVGVLAAALAGEELVGVDAFQLAQECRSG